MRPLLYLISMLCMACCGAIPPPCTLSQPPPPWTAPSDCCSDFKWPAPVEGAQLDAEWLLYDAELVFNNLPDAIKNKYLTNFTAARQAYILSDEAFVKVVKGVLDA